MTVSISSVVNVAIAVGATFPARAGFGTLNIVTNEIDGFKRADRIRLYANIDEVTDDWSASDEVVAAATSYFSQQPKPTSLKISTRYETDQAAELLSSTILDNAANLALFTPITDGSFAISIDGGAEDIESLNFSADTDLSDVADAIETALQAVGTGGYTAATCVHENDRFIITSGTTGVSSTISFLTPVSPASGTDISSLLGMQQGQGKLVDGIVGETITASLTAIQDIDSDWYGLSFTNEVRDNVTINAELAVLAAAAWCEARIKVFANTSNDLNALDSGATSDIAFQLKALSYRRTITTFSSLVSAYPSASVLGRAFTVNFSQPDATITLKFKQLPGIPVEDLTGAQKASLDGKNANAFVDIGGNFMYAESFMANGTFLDELHGLDWLTNAIETNVFGYLLTRGTKVPYTDKGVAALEQQLIKALDEAVVNGFIAPGETIDGTFLPLGYETTVIPVADQNQSDKDARNYPGLSFIVLGAGAIHAVQINGTFER